MEILTTQHVKFRTMEVLNFRPISLNYATMGGRSIPIFKNLHAFNA